MMSYMRLQVCPPEQMSKIRVESKTGVQTRTSIQASIPWYSHSSKILNVISTGKETSILHEGNQVNSFVGTI
jgi:hypothetical protein